MAQKRKTPRVRLDPKTLAVFRELGRLGGQLGGPARAKSLSAERRRAIAQAAARARWKEREKKK